MAQNDSALEGRDSSFSLENCLLHLRALTSELGALVIGSIHALLYGTGEFQRGHLDVFFGNIRDIQKLAAFLFTTR